MATTGKSKHISPMTWIEYIGGDINEMFTQKKTDYGEECSGCMHQGDGFYCNECMRDGDNRSAHDYYAEDDED